MTTIQSYIINQDYEIHKNQDYEIHRKRELNYIFENFQNFFTNQQLKLSEKSSNLTNTLLITLSITCLSKTLIHSLVSKKEHVI